MFTYAYIYKENMHLSYVLYSTQQIESGYLSLFFVTLVWIFTFGVITRAMPTGKGGAIRKAKNEPHILTPESYSRAATATKSILVCPTGSVLGSPALGRVWGNVLYLKSWQ